MVSIINLHRQNTQNIGDLMCAPFRYFGERFGMTGAEILGFMPRENPDQTERQGWKNLFSSASHIVIGGGGLLELDFFKPGLDFVFLNRPRGAKVILWGAGHNDWRLTDWRHLKKRFDFTNYPFDLIGVRDFGHAHDWVPCVSAMDPIFDKQIAEPVHDVVMYAHEGTMRNERFRETLPKNMPILSNSANFDEAIDFLSSANLILTDSFHGAYWATLLGRRVIGFPTSSKFYDVRHPFPLCDPSDWRRYIPMSIPYPEALEECRVANLAFAEKFAQMIDL